MPTSEKTTICFLLSESTARLADDESRSPSFPCVGKELPENTDGGFPDGDKGDILTGLGVSSNKPVGDNVGADVEKASGVATGAIGAGAGNVATLSAVNVPKISAKYRLFPLEEILKEYQLRNSWKVKESM
jgi:hypothetical protein